MDWTEVLIMHNDVIRNFTDLLNEQSNMRIKHNNSRSPMCVQRSNWLLPLTEMSKKFCLNLFTNNSFDFRGC